MECFCKDTLAYIGTAVCAYLLLSLILKLWQGFKVYILSPVFGLSLDVKKLGTWAVVTGATDGIGKGYAFELARRGMNVVLVSRSVEKLKTTATEIENQYGVQIKVIAVDFSQGESLYQNLAIQLKGLDIGVLVNNVGVSYQFPQYFLEVENLDEFLTSQINVNMLSVVKMTQLVLPIMVEKRKGAIINLASASGVGPAQSLLTVYSAAKAFVVYFSSGLTREYKSKGVTIQQVVPFFVATKMSGIRRAGFFWPSGQSYARSALATLGLEDQTYGCIAHAIQGWLLFSLLPEWIMVRIGRRSLEWARQRKLAKLAKRGQ